MAFLAYIISKEGVVVDDAKVQAVTNWPVPENIKKLQRFLCFDTSLETLFQSVAEPHRRKEKILSGTNK